MHGNPYWCRATRSESVGEEAGEVGRPRGVGENGSIETRETCPFLDFDYRAEFLYGSPNTNWG